VRAEAAVVEHGLCVTAMASEPVLTTPDGRYIVVRERLWRAANPHLSAARRAVLVRQLMDARRALRRSASVDARPAARAAVEQAKQALGERGRVWWTDGSPDYNRRLVRNTPYAPWFDQRREAERETGA
jgi:hypothetical protein